MGDYKTNKTTELEDRCCCLLNSLGVIAKKNNAVKVTDTDFICGDKYIDFQYSCNFGDWGDIRIDIVSAYKYKNGNSSNDRQFVQKSFAKMDSNDFGNHQLADFLRTQIEIDKWGKVANTGDKQYPHSLVYFIFNNPDKMINAKIDTPDYIYFVKTKMLLNYIKTNWKTLVKGNRLLLNDKRELGDLHGSAFFAIQLAELLNNKVGFVIETAFIIDNTIK